jgi:hypothetical protein
MILSLEERESSFSLLPLASQLKLTRFDRLLCSSSALSIAYESDVTKLRPNSFTVISVNYASVWKRETDYQIPAELPACPPGGCHCSWNWIHTSMNTNAQGRGEGYGSEMVRLLLLCPSLTVSSKRTFVRHRFSPLPWHFLYSITSSSSATSPDLPTLPTRSRSLPARSRLSARMTRPTARSEPSIPTCTSPPRADLCDGSSPPM